MDKNYLIDKHYLTVLVELDLYPKLRILSEASGIDNIKKIRGKVIQDFIKGLPEEYRKLENYEQIIEGTIYRLEQKDKELEGEER